jgi:hypothetical protein
MTLVADVLFRKSPSQNIDSFGAFFCHSEHSEESTLSDSVLDARLRDDPFEQRIAPR